MALQLGNLRDALAKAGAGDELAAKAAEEVAAYENQLVGLRADFAALRAYVDQQLAELRAHMDRQFAELPADLDSRRRETRLMPSVLIALIIPILVKLFIQG